MAGPGGPGRLLAELSQALAPLTKRVRRHDPARLLVERAVSASRSWPCCGSYRSCSKYPKASTTRLARPAWLYTLIEPKLLRVATVRFGKIGPALPFTSEVTNHTLPG